MGGKLRGTGKKADKVMGFTCKSKGWGRRGWGWSGFADRERGASDGQANGKREEGQESSSNLCIVDKLQVSSDRRRSIKKMEVPEMVIRGKSYRERSEGTIVL